GMEMRLAEMGMTHSEYLFSVAARVGLLHGIVGTAIPLILVCVLTRFFGETKSWREGLYVWRFALFAGLAFTIPYMLTAVFLGPEFPSLIGSMTGLAVAVSALRRGWFTPTTVW